MPGRRPKGRSRAPRRLTSWINAQTAAGAAVTGADTIRELTLFVPLEDHEGATVIRIVGSVWMGPTQDTGVNNVDVYSWGIYIAGSGSAGDLQMSPASALDRDSEHWMHMRHMYFNRSFSGTNDDISMFRSSYLDYAVDIKVMRKVHEGDGIKLAFEATRSYNSIANLRILLKHT